MLADIQMKVGGRCRAGSKMEQIYVGVEMEAGCADEVTIYSWAFGQVF